MEKKKMLDMNERNGKLLALENYIIGKVPDFMIGDKVKPNELGVAAGIFEAGENFFIVDIGDHLKKRSEDPTSTILIWGIAGDGFLRQMIVNPRWLQVIEQPAPKKKAPARRKK